MDILNLANEIVRHGTALSTLAEMTTKPPKEDALARCELIIQLAKDILEQYDDTSTIF